MLPKKGKFFPSGGHEGSDAKDYAAAIATALRAELGDTHQAAKTVMRWSGASERTVKNWLSGAHGPGGNYLIVLMRKSEVVLRAVLVAAGRLDAVDATTMLQAHATGIEVLAAIYREQAGQAEIDAAALNGRGGEATAKSDGTVNGTVNGRVNGTVNPPTGVGINARQRWFLGELGSGHGVTAADLRLRWSVSERTARRDASALKARGIIEFVGSFKTGKYLLVDQI